MATAAKGIACRWAAFEGLIGPMLVLVCAQLWGTTAHAAHPSSGPRAPRTAVPFQDAYRDGYAWVTWGAQGADSVEAKLKRIQQSGARHLIVPYLGCQSDIHSSDVGGCEMASGVSGQSLAQAAVGAGFTDISYLPIVLTPDWKWRGYFEPSDVDEWFRTYTIWIKRVARDAKALGMKELIVSTETTRLYKHEAKWRQVLADVRTEFSGPLILNVNWDDTKHSFWDAADAIGVSAYFPLRSNADPTQQELDAAWQVKHDELVALSRKWKRPLYLTEVGYQSVASAAKTPWESPAGVASDFELQARCFEAFRKAWAGEKALVRANIWATSVEDPTSKNYPFSFEVLGKPAEAVLKTFFQHR